jgi:hypothetical protein
MVNTQIKVIKEVNYSHIENSVNEFLRSIHSSSVIDVKVCGSEREIVVVIIYKMLQ